MGIVVYKGYAADGSIRDEYTKEMKKVKRYAKVKSKEERKKVTDPDEAARRVK